MKIQNHYYECLDLLENMFKAVFRDITNKCADQITTVNSQYEFEPIMIADKVPRFSFKEVVELLEEHSIKQSIDEDLSRENEYAFGQIVKQSHSTDLYVIYNYPISCRPFYTMPNPKDPRFTNSYDFFLRGEEILSGAQRIHNCQLLLESAEKHGIELGKVDSSLAYDDPSSTSQNESESHQESKNLNILTYANSFRYGAPMHAGAGIGFERIVKLYLGLDNIRK
jgi:aspartyl/asparaginyl-tRNA synthetase